MRAISPEECCVLNAGPGAWAFEPLAAGLASALGAEISETPRSYNYLLHWDGGVFGADQRTFISLESIAIAADKRRLAHMFAEAHVPTPETMLVPTFEEVVHVVRERSDKDWCLKYPAGCGGSGHRMLSVHDSEPFNWPKPFVVQEFVRLGIPEVYRTYCAGGEVFGWMARRFPAGRPVSPWIAHARGAEYVRLETIPAPALEAAKIALVASGLIDSFGCADLIRRPSGEWLVLEVGTDGLVNHVDRDLGDVAFETTLSRKIADAFWKQVRVS